MQRLAAGGEGHGGERLELWLPLVHVGQQAVVVDLNLGLLQGRHHRLLHLRVAEARGGGLRNSEHHVDTPTLDAQFLQRLHGGENVHAVAIDDGVIWTQTRTRRCATVTFLVSMIRSRKSKITFEFLVFQTQECKSELGTDEKEHRLPLNGAVLQSNPFNQDFVSQLSWKRPGGADLRVRKREARCMQGSHRNTPPLREQPQRRRELQSLCLRQLSAES